MGASFFRGLFRRRRQRPFLAWQIELTTRCPLMCRMCIRNACPDWRSTDMHLDDFGKIAPYLELVETAVLEGWGEPLLYRDLSSVVRMVKSSGCRAGFVTSGQGMDNARASELIDAGLDFMGFSIAGVTARTHNAIRINSDLAVLSETIREVVRIRSEKRLGRPRLHLVYLMLGDNLDEVPCLPEFARSLGIEEVLVINLIQVVSEWQQKQNVQYNAAEKAESLLKDAEERAGSMGIRLRRPSLSPLEIALCDENPLRNLFISVDGEVSPCVYLHPPTPSPYRKIFQGRDCIAGKLSFGNIFRSGLESIWNAARYVEFRNHLISREKALHDLFSDTRARAAYLKGKELPSPPGPCETCHKMLGF